MITSVAMSSIAAAPDALGRAEGMVTVRFDGDPHRQVAALYDIDHIDAALLLSARDLASHARGRGAVADAA
jgi:hypothetical protein